MHHGCVAGANAGGEGSGGWWPTSPSLALEQEQPRYVRGELGPVPDSTRGRRAWRQAAAIEDYRRSYQMTDPEQGLGRMPGEPAQRVAWQHARHAITRVQGRHHRIDHDRQPQRGAASRRQSIDRHQQDQAPTRTERAVPPGRPDPERAAG